MEELNQSEVTAAVLKDKDNLISLKDQLLAENPQPKPTLIKPTEQPEVTSLFKDAIIYDNHNDRWLVMGIQNTDYGNLYTIQSTSNLIEISEDQLCNFKKYKSTYAFPSLVNQGTDIDVWRAKRAKSHLKGRIKFRPQEHLTFISESCPDHFDSSSLCVYLKRIMFSKKQFDLHSDCDFPVTDKQFIQLWLERLKEDKGYGEDLRNLVKTLTSVQNTVAGLIESLADALELTNDPKALLNAFRQNIQNQSENIKAYVFRKQQEGRTILLEGNHNIMEMVEVVIRGMKEEEPIKHKLLGKFEKGQINTFDQLATTLSIQLKKHRGNSLQTSAVEQVNAITNYGRFNANSNSERFQPRREDRKQNS